VVLRGTRTDRLTEEVQAHLDLLTSEYRSRGLTPDEARRAARRAFGSVPRITESYRDRQGLPFLDAALHDVRFAARLLRHDRAFAFTAVFVLGLGIGVNNMLFTILNAHTLRGLPIDDVERVLFLTTADDRAPDRGVSYPDFVDWQNGAGSFAALAAFSNAPAILSEDGRTAERLDGGFVSAEAFSVVGVQPVLGRNFTPDDDRAGAPAVVILGRGTWQARYAGDRAVLGKVIDVNGAAATIVGVMPDRSGFPSTAQIWMPLSQYPGFARESRDARPLRVLGRLRDDRSVAEARAEIEAIAVRLSEQHPASNSKIRARVVPVNEQYLGSVTNPAWLAFMTAGVLIVLISSANVGNLLLAQSVKRAREIAVRASLGATRARVIRQLLIEGAVLATVGGVLGLGVAVAGVRIFRSAIPDNVLPYWFDYSLDVRVLAALVGVSILTVFVFALLPAIHASRADLTAVLKDGGRSGIGSRGRRWATAFLAAECGLAVVLLSHLVVNVRTSVAPQPSDVALDSREVLTATITLPAERYKSADLRAAFYSELTDRLAVLSVVEAVSLTGTPPPLGAEEVRVAFEGVPDSGADSLARTVAIGPGYFKTFGLTLARGREFIAKGGPSGLTEALVNEPFARRYFADRDPIGHRVAIVPRQGDPAEPDWLTIVGVAPAIRHRPGSGNDSVLYLPFAAGTPVTATLMVRSRADTASLTARLRAEVAAIDRNLPLYRIRTMSQVIRDALWNARVANRLFLTLTFIAVTLAVVGMYAVTAHAVSQRRQEIGVRMALGARPRQIVRLIARRVAGQVAVGFLAGVALTRLWASAFSSGQADVTATDPLSLLGVAAILLVMTTIACFVPARRATRLDPVASIRHD
jgi:putative ABC transport system permease protein